MESVRIASYPLTYGAGVVDGSWTRSRRRWPERTRAVVLVNPNNPTGSFVKRRELAGLIELCAARGLAIVSDEVFLDYAFGEDTERAGSLAAVDSVLTFALSGLSKVAGLPQMKLGWIVTGGPAAERAAAIERLEVRSPILIFRWRLRCSMRSGGCCGQGGIREQIRARTRGGICQGCWKRRRRIPRSGCWRWKGGWYATVRTPRVRTEEEWTLEKPCWIGAGVLVQPGVFFYDFDQDGLLVLSLLTAPGVFCGGRAARGGVCGGGGGVERESSTCYGTCLVGQAVRLPSPIMPEYRRRLPHFHPTEAYVFLTWRLAGSLPAKVESTSYATAGHAFVAQDRVLDRGVSGPVWLGDPRIADLVAQAILIGDTERHFY